MNVDIRYIKVCALCKYWDDSLKKHVSKSNIPFHYCYDAFARETCICKAHKTYGGQPACRDYECKFI